MTECNQETFAFTSHFSRRVEAGFTAGQVSSDGGSLLLREVDRRINLVSRLAACFIDGRVADRVEHQVPQMLAQRIYGLALGYEDLNDHEQLRSDPLLALLSGKRELEAPLAGKSTLNRLELTGRSARYHKIDYSAEAIDRLLVDLYIESHAVMPSEVVLDLDATDIPLYGHQPERFFHGYYDSYCYLPLYIFAGDQLLCARLSRRAWQPRSPVAGTRAEYSLRDTRDSLGRRANLGATRGATLIRRTRHAIHYQLIRSIIR